MGRLSAEGTEGDLSEELRKKPPSGFIVSDLHSNMSLYDLPTRAKN
jgi:hypothetical protein